MRNRGIQDHELILPYYLFVCNDFLLTKVSFSHGESAGIMGKAIPFVCGDNTLQNSNNI